MEFLFVLFTMLIGLAATLFWVLALIEIVRSEFNDKNDRLVWLLLVILLPFIGTVLYLMIGRKQRLGTDML